MKIEGYIEITEEEYDNLPDEVVGGIFFDDEQGNFYFKKAQKFPIVFEDGSRKIEVYEKDIWLINKINKEQISFRCDASFPLLLKAVKKAEEIMKKNDA